MGAISVQIRLDTGECFTLPVMEETTGSDIVRFTAHCAEIAEIDEFWIDRHHVRNVYLFDYHIRLSVSSCRRSYGLAREKGIVIKLVPDYTPERILAQYLHRDWWTRPAFPHSIAQIPERTASLCFKKESGYAYFLPVCGRISKAEISGGEGSALHMEINNYTDGISQADDFAFACAEGGDLYRLIAETFEASAAHHPHKPPLKKQKHYPDLFEYLGWCSWDAFYTQVNEAGLLQKADEFTEKGIPVRWMLIDDGWLTTQDEALCAFEEDSVKFPHGFTALIDTLKKEKGIAQVGVWHALGGYWGGVLPGSGLALAQSERLYATKKNKLLPHYQPERGFGFWNDWYDYLRKSGIDFVKVDGQSALKNYYGGERPIGEVAGGTHRALEAAVCASFEGRIINCMGMSAENIWSRTFTALARNSDDFVPDSKEGFAEHVLQNAYNALYHGQMCYCDWDMFWSSHFDAKRHAVLRAVSGGPVYCSDKVGETNAEVINPLVYADGRIIRCDGDGLPTEDCLWRDPTEEGTLFAITNRVGSSTVMALFNLTEKPLTSALPGIARHDMQWDAQLDTQLPESSGEFVMYDHFSQKVEIITAHNEAINDTKKITVSLDGFGVGLLLFIPMTGRLTPIGLTDKYVSVHAVQYQKEYECYTLLGLREGGCFAFCAETTPNKIIAGDTDVTGLLLNRENYYVLPLPETNAPLELAFYFTDLHEAGESLS